MAQVDFSQVSKYYGGLPAVQDATLRIREGEFFSLLGPSGSGKTTLLRMVAGFVHPDEGAIKIGDRVVNDLPPHKRNIGMVFQHYALFPHRTVAENVAFGLQMRKASPDDIRNRVAEALQLVQLEARGSSYPRELSGGQQQRVAIARSIAMRPSLLLLDEPLSALDRKLRTDMQVELRALQQKLGITALYVTHDQEEALSMSDRIAVMNGGKIVQQGTARELYDQPRTAFVANFLGSANVIDITVHKSGTECTGSVNGHSIPLFAPPEARDGQAAKLALRPERLRILSSEASHSGAQLKGVVTAVSYMGSDIRVLVAVDDRLLINARIDAQTQKGADFFREGDPIFVVWDPREAIYVSS
ncbi:ABC transporter ATP-binding protein (plasmid) [Agrobacterium leguminum]|uniref:Spermidine/putrescine import ATP-binding protein PotA n=1 Tax=Agrobacterium deltaense NCPPB 1641 TaxID=1183425 RepID=A0A1S7U9K2_9HYPH|nr:MULTISPECIES: ABC transporter ATP-binding protein [Agrobacterium]WFS69622.1 ABC transporter ATP-binding protein [Agrobacterium leguminum]CVI63600.1 Spermidine/putrescine import ATP-binding protein PotA [Agrobacterium deltaense NCPPB 1641]